MTDDTSIWVMATDDGVTQGTFKDGRFTPLDQPQPAVSGSGVVWFEDAVAHALCTPLTLREVVEALGYDLTADSPVDRILTDNPEGPWTLEDLETMFGPSVRADNPHLVDQDDKTLTACAARFPHTVTFEPWPEAAADEDPRP